MLAYYYAWWDPANFGQTLFQPARRTTRTTSSVIQQHVQEAQSAGIDGFVMSWYGNGDRTDTNLAHLLDIAQKSGFRATIHFETGHMWGVDDVVAQLQAFYANRINSPAIVRYQGRPVIFFWQAGMYDNATWDAIRAQVDPERTAVWIADGDQFGILSGDAWDGISPYAIAWSANPAAQLPSWAAKAQAVAPEKLWIPPVSPGCNDSAARAATCVAGSRGRVVLPGDVGRRAGFGAAVGDHREHVQRVDGVHPDRAECAVRRPVPADHAPERRRLPRALLQAAATV